MLMVVILHIMAAVGSMLAATAAYVTPTRTKLRYAYALSSVMLGSGIYLVALNTAHLLEACVTGLGFLAVVGIQLTAAHKKLAR